MPLPEKIARRMRAWAARRVEQRLRDEWNTYDHHPDVKLRRLRAEGAPTIQVNFYRHPREPKGG